MVVVLVLFYFSWGGIFVMVTLVREEVREICLGCLVGTGCVFVCMAIDSQGIELFLFCSFGYVGRSGV